MKLKTPPMSRRAVLRGLGATIALPMLDAMRPTMAFAQMQPERPKSRFLAYYVPCGIHMASWTPPTPGPDFEMTPILAPLADLRAKLLVLSGIDNHPARPDGPGDHAAGTGSFLTAAHCYKTEGANISNGVSIDQVIANAVGQGHRFPSLVLGAEGGGNAGGCDSGYSCAYSRNISWIDAQTPAAKETNPRVVFNRLFGADASGLTPGEAAKKRRYRKSVLDFVLGDAQRLKGKLGPTDRQKMDAYLSSVRELERQIDLAAASACEAGPEPERPVDVRDTLRNMADLMVKAFECDLTPVTTFMLGNGGSNRPYPFLGISDGHHQLSHHQGNPDNHRQLEIIDIWEVEQLAYLLGRLDAVEDVDGSSLLDNTVVFFSSEIEDGNSHRHDDLPILVAGGAGGQLQGGRHVRFEGHTPIADLFSALSGLCGGPTAAFGDDGTGALALG